MSRSWPDLDESQRSLLDEWLPGAEVVADHSWDLRHRHVLEVVHAGIRYAVKAGSPSDGHMLREIRAHREWLAPWTSTGHAPPMVHADPDTLLLVTRWLPGRLVEDSTAQHDPDTFRQAGALLARLHGQLSVVDPAHERDETERALRWLDSPHRIPAPTESRLRAEIASWDLDVETVLVPTHGDWQPRNWLVHDGVVAVIDLGRADLRTPMSDLARLAAQDFRRDAALETAFLEGYGDDPRDPDLWVRMKVREAIGTASWAFQHGDAGFEEQGHRMIREALGTDVPPVA
ncbi:phosphotransferase family protein [Nocardioides currus]|uniref:Aminoglycoside phosphotransferase n=1 Tax=Nocardioides currus TaxID=2133958 RepID=A0A2R7YRZ2_9ACTN|nr:phosphotransferase [Nocardioides currus]PUA79185.1 aminoglycoside phosphotransferase [Nocardioides currus]